MNVRETYLMRDNGSNLGTRTQASCYLYYLTCIWYLQIIGFDKQEVAIYIAVVGFLSVIVQVWYHTKGLHVVIYIRYVNSKTCCFIPFQTSKIYLNPLNNCQEIIQSKNDFMPAPRLMPFLWLFNFNHLWFCFCQV